MPRSRLLPCLTIALVASVAAASEYDAALDRISTALVADLGSKGAKVAVLDFTDPRGRPHPRGAQLAHDLATELSNKGGARWVERTKVEAARKALSLTEASIVDHDTALEIGRRAGAGALLLGELSAMKDSLNLNVTVVEVATGALVATRRVSLPRDLFGSDEPDAIAAAPAMPAAPAAPAEPAAPAAPARAPAPAAAPAPPAPPAASAPATVAPAPAVATTAPPAPPAPPPPTTTPPPAAPAAPASPAAGERDRKRAAPALSCRDLDVTRGGVRYGVRGPIFDLTFTNRGSAPAPVGSADCRLAYALDETGLRLTCRSVAYQGGSAGGASTTAAPGESVVVTVELDGAPMPDWVTLFWDLGEGEPCVIEGISMSGARRRSK